MSAGDIRLGRMGTPMAPLLLGAGFPPAVVSRTKRSALPRRDAGPTAAESPAEQAGGSA
jgi:3-hydroxyisobutyrate dehydrogenase-like beta-hydroxyacid dehydrogenase